MLKERPGGRKYKMIKVLSQAITIYWLYIEKIGKDN